MLGFLKKIFGTKQEKDVKAYGPVVEQINEAGAVISALDNDGLRNKTNEFRERIREHLASIDSELVELRESAEREEDVFSKEDIYNAIDRKIKERDQQIEEVLRTILPEAFAVVRETARRFTENEKITVRATDHDRNLAVTKPYIQLDGDFAHYANSWMAAGGQIVWNMVHYDVQLIGGMVLHDGKIAEMATGEGKTLVATLPAYLNGLTGEGVHIVTVNDYLARRDSEWVRPIFEFLMLTVDCIDKYKPNSVQRKQAYRCDITYGTNNEFGFDYLRDNMVRSVDERVQSKHHYAMVDEVDSVLVDDARTPLIISGPVDVDEESEEYNVLKPKVEKLINEQRRLATQFLSDARKKITEHTSVGYQEGEGGLDLFRSYRAMPKARPLIKYLSEDGIRNILHKTENYYMQEQSKNMRVADEPLLFTIDEKNRQVELTALGIDFLSKGESDNNFFVIPDLSAEIHSLENDDALPKEEKVKAKEKILDEFSIKSKRLHCVSQLLKAYTLFEKDEEYVVIEGHVKIVDEGTGRLLEGRRYSDGLHQAIEAKESVKVGELTQTYATITLQNYFRMYHKLAGMTGTAETEAGEFWQIYKLDVVVIPTNKKVVRDDREDLVYKTAREKFNAVIDEISKCTADGRPVLVGTTSVDISEKLSRMLQLRGIAHNVLNAKQHQREAEIVAEAGKPGKVTIATNMAGRGTDIKITDEVKRAGGLAIVGTERHESRRVDRQLRGRAGRQGDPGSSQFFVSFEDNLMRLFNSDRITGIMDKLGHKEGEVLQHPMVTKSIERAQKKVEENNFGIRKRLLEYDDVMNIQREAIYKKRNHALYGDRLAVDLSYTFHSAVEQLVAKHKQRGDYEAFIYEVLSTLGFEPSLDETRFREAPESEIAQEIGNQFFDWYHHKAEQIREVLLPLIRNVKLQEGNKYARVAIPVSDGTTEPMPIGVEMDEAISSGGRSIMRDIEKTIALMKLDQNWKEHLRDMDELKESVQAASFEQKDPLVIYKLEAYKLFEQLVYKMNQEITSYLAKCRLMFSVDQQVSEARAQRTDYSKTTTSRSEENMRRAAEEAGGAARQAIQTVRNAAPKVGRNDLCPCGSGKKFKNCHGNS